jgi:hypothetical protein
MMNWKMGGLRIWLFRALVAIAGIVMLVAFTRPWWSATVDTGESVLVYGWGLRNNLNTLASYVAADVTPTWQVALAWVYVGASLVLAVSSTWFKKWWGSLLLGATGLGFISYAAVALNVVVKNRLVNHYYNFPLQGNGYVNSELATVIIKTAIHNGYYLAYAGGALLVLLALLQALSKYGPFRRKLSRS